jgi:methylglutaconyl-CoA hydratase
MQTLIIKTMAETYQTLEIIREKSISTVWLNRPGVHNALDRQMISELSLALSELAADRSTRLAAIRGRGKSFCAGADIKWMKGGAGLAAEDNYREVRMLSDLYRQIYTFPKPLVTVVHGASSGGANGIVAASDIAVCSDDAVFSLSEVRLGLVPSVIAPYIIRRTGEFPARELMLTAKKIYGTEAARIGLVNRSCQLREIDQVIEDMYLQLLEGGPQALELCKKLILEVCNGVAPGDPDGYTADLLASIRVSEEGQEGMAAFLEKRKPGWHQK